MSNLITINGSENLRTLKDNKYKALVNFYKAFNERDIELMKKIWLNTDEVSMNNPLGGIMRGWENIESVYHRVFNGSAKVYVEFYDFTMHHTEKMFLVTGKEKGHFKKGYTKVDLAIRTSRVFIKVGNNWKQIQHHGSIDNPELLKKYQEAVMNK